MMKIILVCGARPNFMKIAPLMRTVEQQNSSSSGRLIEPFLVHTGQHYDYKMSQIFFQDLELPEPNIHLDVGSGTHAEQTGKVMIGFEKVVFQEEPDLVVVVGDVNSTLAAALTATKLHIPIAHVEAGLRSFDRTMPEEINRFLTDAISDYLFTPSPDADKNLRREGVAEGKIYLVGDIMVDSLLHNKEKARSSQVLSQSGVSPGNYALLTLHRPSNVDEKGSLLKIGKALKEISQRIPIVFPAHPRTRKNIEKFGLNGFFEDKRTLLIEPLGYLDFLKLMMDCKFAMTDSGGIQEETTVLGIPCLTLRNTTERPVTVSQGTNTLVWNDTEKIVEEASAILDGRGKKGNCPEFWDGKTAERIVDILVQN
ncbi:non-hydrolyzing UDP-N-acetylglucosamine 2-epimerase [Chloroflexota bacterium]